MRKVRLILLLTIIFSGMAVSAAESDVIFQDVYTAGEIPAGWSGTGVDAAYADNDGMSMRIASPDGDAMDAREGTKSFAGAQGILKYTARFKVSGNATKILLISNAAAGRAFSGFIENGRFYHNNFGGEFVIADYVEPDVVHTLQIYFNSSRYTMDIIFDGEVKQKDCGFFSNADSIDTIYAATYRGGAIQFYDMRMERLAKQALTIEAPVVQIDGQAAQKLTAGTVSATLSYQNDTAEEENAVLFLCVYEGDRLVQIKTKSAVFGAFSAGETGAEIELADAAGKQLDVFLWKSFADNFAVFDSTVTLVP